MADFITEANSLIVENHNKKPGVQRIVSMYQLDHGGWRGDFCGHLSKLVKERAARSGALILAIPGRSPAEGAAAEVLTSLAVRCIWGVN